jgi:iron complex outermembrane receptor protein
MTYNFTFPKKRKHLWLIFLFYLITFTLHAVSQERLTITGIVKSKVNNETLPGVSVTLKGTNVGTVTNIDGKFSFQIPSNTGKMVFSFLGFATQEIVLGSKSYFEIVMVEAASNLNEVVVIGYGSVQKKDITGAVTTVTEKDFQKGSITSPE